MARRRNKRLQAIRKEVGKLYKLNKRELSYAWRRFRHVTSVDLSGLPELVYRDAKCGFVLSTGRCGTKLITELLNASKDVDCEHTPSPELVHASKEAYEKIWSNRELFVTCLRMARYDLVRDAYLRNLVYVETNNRITFFAPALPAVFQRAKFIHLLRHPGDFVRSGIRRGWYMGDDSIQLGKIVGSDNHGWDSMSQIERIAWL